ncbi:hypothetical protein FRC17_004712, partial [Serendipita sp. 399]
VIFACSRDDITRCLPINASGGLTRFTAVETVLASVSSPFLFPHAEIGGRRKRSYVGPGTTFFNPIRELLTEAERLYGPERGVATVLSLGYGVSEIFAEKPRGSLSETESYLHDAIIAGAVTTAEVGYQFYGVGAYIRLAVPGGFGNTILDGWMEWDVMRIEDRTNAYMRSEEVANSVRFATEEIVARSTSVTIGRLNHTAIKKITPKAIPPVSPYFVLRSEAWNFMKSELLQTASNEQLIFVLSGMGGVGKTQMTSFWVQEYGTRYDHIFFVDARSTRSLRNDLQRAIRSLGSEHSQATFAEALEYLNSHKGWLLIFDNADDPALRIDEYIPKATHGTIIITTRNRDLGFLTARKHWGLGPMDLNEGVEALCRAAHIPFPQSLHDDDATVLLTRRLGRLALALVQAGSYCYRISSTSNPHFDFLDYLALLEVGEAELLDDPGAKALDNYGKSTYATLNISYEQLPEITRQFLHMAAYFHHSDIALLMLKTSVEYNFYMKKAETHERPSSYREARHELSNLLNPPTKATILRLHDIIFSLQSFSLVTPTMSPTTVLLRFHPIVHSWARTKLPAESNDLFRQMATQVIAGCCDESLYQLHPTLMPHIYVMIDRHDVLHPNDREAFQMLLREQGDYRMAEDMANEQVAYMIGQFGDDHNFTAAAIASLATVFTCQGKWELAIERYKYAIQMLEPLIGLNHPVTLSILENLAHTYRDQGALEDAEHLFNDLIKRWSSAVAEDDPRTLALMDALSTVYINQGKFQEAEQISLYAIALMTDSPRENNPLLLKIRANLSVLYTRSNRHEEAEAIQRETMESSRTMLGETNPVSVGMTNMLAATLFEQEKWEEAEPLLLESLKTSRRKFGEENPQTMGMMYNLARVYLGMGRYPEAANLMEELLPLRISTSRTHHKDTIITMHDLAYIYYRHKDYKKCLDLAGECLTIVEKVEGEGSDCTLRTLSLMGQAYTNIRDWDNANSTYTILLDRQRRRYGPSVTVGDTMLRLANTCLNGDELADGIMLINEALDLSRQLEGSAEEGLSEFREDLAATLHRIPSALSKVF